MQHVLAGAADDLLEDVVLFLIVEKLRHLERPSSARTAAAQVVDLDGGDPLGVRIGKRIQQDVLNRR